MSENNFTPGKKQKQISPAGDPVKMAAVFLCAKNNNSIFFADHQPRAIANVFAKYGAVIFGESPNTEHRTLKKRTTNALYWRFSQCMGLLFGGKSPDTGHRTRKSKDINNFNIVIVCSTLIRDKYRQTRIFVYTKRKTGTYKVPNLTQANKRFLQEGGRISKTKAVCHV